MEPNGSLSQLQVPATYLYFEPDQSNPSPRHTPWRSILILSSQLCLDLPAGLFPSGFPTKPLYTLLPMRATRPAHFILLYLVTRTVFCEEYRSLSSSLCSFLHSSVISSLLGQNILLNTLFSDTLRTLLPSMWETKLQTHTTQQTKLHFRIS
jgi:hypothetical protein